MDTLSTKKLEELYELLSNKTLLLLEEMHKKKRNEQLLLKLSNEVKELQKMIREKKTAGLN